MPSVAELERTVAEHGSPVRDELFPGVVPAPDAATRQLALLSLVGDGFRVEKPAGAARFAPLEIEGARGVDRVGRCARARIAPDRVLWVRGLPSQARIRTTSAVPIEGTVFLDHGGAARSIFADFSTRPRDIVVPDVGDGLPWNLTVDSPAVATEVTTCLLAGKAVVSTDTPEVGTERW
jgi:hypothetical protein